MFEKAQFPALSHVYICPHVSGKLLHFLDTVQRFPSGQHLAQTVQHVVAFWKCSAARKPNVTGPITSLLRDQGKSVSAPSELHVPLFLCNRHLFKVLWFFFFLLQSIYLRGHSLPVLSHLSAKTRKRKSCWTLVPAGGNVQVSVLASWRNYFTTLSECVWEKEKGEVEMFWNVTSSVLLVSWLSYKKVWPRLLLLLWFSCFSPKKNKMQP